MEQFINYKIPRANWKINSAFVFVLFLEHKAQFLDYNLRIFYQSLLNGQVFYYMTDP